MRNLLLALLVPLFLAGCGAEPIWAPDEQVKAAIYRAPGPAKLALFTMVNNRSQEGAHTGLMVNGSQRVLFDPAGTFYHPSIPERNDVHFGIRDNVLNFYLDYHARESFHVVIQEIEVSPEVAELALRLVQEQGAVSKAMCTNSTSSILSQLPGLESIRTTWFPGKLRKQFAAIPGVREAKVFDDSPDYNKALPQQVTLN
jgi:hypothetical protein